MDIKYKSLLLASCFIFTKAYAGTASSNLQVTATVTANCTITTGNLAFGAYDPTSATDLSGTGTVTVTCTQGAGSFIGMDNGKNYDTTRRMKATNDGTFLKYSLYQPSTTTPGAACPTSIASASAWGNTSATGLAIGIAPSNASRQYNVCGNIPQGQDVKGGNAYSDLVSATINF